MATYVAEHASIHPRAEIDADVEIGPFCVIGPNVRIGTRHAAGKQRHADGPRHARPAQPHVSRRGHRRRAAGHQLPRQRHASDHRRPQHHPRMRDDQSRHRKRRRRHRRRQPQLPDGLLPRRPRLPAGQPHHHRQRHAAGRARSRPRSCLALGRRGRAPLCLDRQLQLYRRLQPRAARRAAVHAGRRPSGPAALHQRRGAEAQRVSRPT